MTRLLALTTSAAVVFVGAGLPFLVPGDTGLLASLLVVAAGAALLWYAERRTAHSLDAESAWKGLMKADGENLVESESTAAGTAAQRPLIFLVIALAAFALAWLGSRIDEAYGRFWLAVYELGAVGALWLLYRAGLFSSARDAGES